MTTEGWVTILLAAGAALLALAAVAGVRAGRWPARRARRAALGSQSGALVALVAALLLALALYGGSALLNVRLVAGFLILAASAIHLALALTLGRPAGLWPVHTLLAGLLAAVLFAAAPGRAASLCVPRTLPFFVEWTLYLFGGGALLVAGGAGVLALARRGGQSWPDKGEEQELLVAALLLALFSLGGGLLVGTWWAWQTTGTLLAGDTRSVCVAVSWTVIAMALVAAELQEHAYRWMGGLAVVAASILVLGLLVLPDLNRLWGG